MKISSFLFICERVPRTALIRAIGKKSIGARNPSAFSVLRFGYSMEASIDFR